MKNDGYTRKERETSIVFNEEEGSATVWTASDAFERKMNDLGIEGQAYGGGIRWLLPKGWIKVRKARILTEEQRNALKERGKTLSLLPRSSNYKAKTT